VLHSLRRGAAWVPRSFRCLYKRVSLKLISRFCQVSILSFSIAGPAPAALLVSMPKSDLNFIEKMARIPTLTTERLVMRPPSPGDLEDLAALFGDSDVMHFVGHGKTFSATQVAHMMEGMLTEARHGSLHPSYVPGVAGSLVIVKPDTQEVIGIGVLRMLAPDLTAAIAECPDPALEVGYLLSRESWGKGYATEVAKEMVRYGVALVGKEHVVAVADVGNTASHAVLRKAGFAVRKELDYRDMRMNYWELE
jgi:ribosomal-protein-alanine N-acetyltransferase